MIGAVAGVRLLTELLEPAAYGEFALAMTAATLVNQTILGPLAGGVLRFYAPAREAADVGGYLRAARRSTASATAVVLLLMLVAVAAALAAGQATLVGVICTAFLFAVLSGYNGILNGFQSAMRRRVVVALHQGLESWARFLLAAAFIVVLGASSGIALAGYCLAAVLVLCSQYLFLPPTDSEPPASDASWRQWRHQMWGYAWPISVFGVFTWGQFASDRWALGLTATTQEVGLYSVLYQLGYYPMSMATGLAVQFLAPIYFQRAGDASDAGRNKDVRALSWRLTSMALALAAVVFLLGFAFHAKIFALLVAKEYASVSALLPWTLLAGGLVAAGDTIALSLMSQLKTRAMIAPKVGTALLGIALNVAGAYWYGITGVVFATLIFAIAYAAWMSLLAIRVGKQG